MTRYALIGLLAVLQAGCSSWAKDRLLFVEESHIGLKAKVGPDHAPGDIDFGYRRSIVAVIPKADASAPSSELKKSLDVVQKAARVKAERAALAEKKSEEETLALVSKAVQEATGKFIADVEAANGDSPGCPTTVLDRSEPLSVISSFTADVRWLEASRVHTYFASGIAATRTACDVHAIKALVAVPME